MQIGVEEMTGPLADLGEQEREKRRTAQRSSRHAGKHVSGRAHTHKASPAAGDECARTERGKRERRSAGAIRGLAWEKRRTAQRSSRHAGKHVSGRAHTHKASPAAGDECARTEGGTTLSDSAETNWRS